MRVVLVGMPTKNIGNQFPNLGALTIAQHILQKGHEVHIIDAVRYGYTIEDILNQIRELKPDLVGLSGIVTTYYFFEPLANGLKAMLPGIPVVVGGGITCVADLIEKHTSIDYMIKGEGENAIMKLISVLEDRMRPDDVDVAGLYVRKGHAFRPPSIEQEYPDLSDMPYPAYNLYDMEYYIESSTKNAYRFLQLYPGVREEVGEGVRFFPVTITRGCPYKCSFCFRFIKKFRHPSIQNAVNHIKMIVETYHCEGLNLLDELIVTDKKWFIEFCKTLATETPRLKIFAGAGRANLLTPEMIHYAREAGFIRIGCGIESGSQRILDRLNKRTTVAQNRDAIQNVKSAGMMATCNFIFGTPGEDMSSLKETEKFIAENLDPRDYAVNLAIAYPGTPMFDHAVEAGLLKQEELHNYVLNLSFGNYPLNLSDFGSSESLRRGVSLMQFRLTLKVLLKENKLLPLLKELLRGARIEIIYFLSLVAPAMIRKLRKYNDVRRHQKFRQNLIGRPG